jgi:PKD repeat protein
MIKITICAVFILSSFFLYAQKEDYNWVLSNHLRVDFNQQPPIITTDILPSVGNAVNITSISDNSGSLLFYVNGFRLYNYNHQNIFTTPAAQLTDRVNVVPHPSESKKYFWIVPLIGLPETKKLVLYTIDMNANGGFANVTETNSFIGAEMTTNFVIARKNNSPDYWFIRFFPDRITVNLLTSTGFDGSTLFNFLLNESLSGNRITPDAKNIFVSSSYSHIGVFDFNDQSGTLSNFRYILFLDTNYVCSYEFSRNNEFVYVAKQNTTTYETTISQFSMHSINSETEFRNSERVMYHQTLDFNYPMRDMQLAPNNKIYITFNDFYLWSIDNPDLPFPNCTVNSQSLWLNGVKSGLNLPNYFNYYASFNYLQLCNVINFNYIGFSGESYLWNFGDSQTSTEIEPTHIYTNAGTYTITLEITFTDNSTQTITKIIEILDKPMQISIEHE